MVHGLEILIPTVLLLGTGFLVILLSRVLRTSPIVGFVIAGLALGPAGLGVIEENETTSLLAELGVAFLLFDIGLHFSVRSAWTKRRDFLGLAPLQVFLCGIVLGFSVAFLFGLKAEIAILAGLTLALSSTAIVMQMVADFKQTESPVGQSAKTVLIFQDLAAIFLLIFADSLGGEGSLGMLVLLTLLKTGLAFVAAIALGQLVLTPLMKSIIRYDDPEMFTILGLFIVMMTGLATASTGLSLTLGAFLAGMVLAETPFRVLLQTELRPFRSLLMALFFIRIGMIMDPAAILAQADVVMSIVAVIITVKAAIVCALMFVFRRPPHHSIQLAFLLAQGSEFAFVIFSMGTVEGALGSALAQQLIAAVAISMILTPFLCVLANRFSLKLCNALDSTITNCPEGNENPISKRPVFIIGMNEVGKTIARGMKAHDIPYIAVEYDRKRFLEATAAGYIVAYGDPADLRFWNTMGVNRARAISIATPRYEVAKNLSPVIQKLYANLRRYVAVKDSADGVRFAALGATPVHNHGTPPGLEITSLMLQEFGFPEEDIQPWREEEQSAYLESNKSTSGEQLNPAAA